MATITDSTGQYLHAAKDLRLETRELPGLGPEEVQVAIRSTTLCGSDLHYFSNFKNGSILVREPLCLGHESAGEVLDVGASVQNLKVGDAVALEVGVPCETCDFCISKRYNICPNLRFRSSGSKFPHYQGTLQERVNHPAKWVYKLPPELDFEAGALLEPLAVAVHAVRLAEACTYPFTRDSCLIFGAGAVGLLTAVAAQAAGVKNIVMADIHRGRLQFALEHGFATAVYPVQARRTETIEEGMANAAQTAREIEELKWPDGSSVSKVNVAFECTGISSCVQASVYVSAIHSSREYIAMSFANVCTGNKIRRLSRGSRPRYA